MSTPFDEEAVDQLFNLGVKRFKISGFESTDLRFIRYVASTGLPLIISAGIGTTLGFIKQILDVCEEVKNQDVTILHCNNAYPTPIEDTNLFCYSTLLHNHLDSLTINYSLKMKYMYIV